jgi:hypothetical protein
MDFLQQHGLLVDAGKHQLIMTASMKVVRVVAPSSGPCGPFTAVASSSPEYRRLFAEFQEGRRYLAAMWGLQKTEQRDQG